MIDEYYFDRIREGFDESNKAFHEKCLLQLKCAIIQELQTAYHEGEKCTKQVDIYGRRNNEM